MTDEHDLIERITASLRDRGAARPGFDLRVMAAIREPRPSPLRAGWVWLTEPRLVSVSPIGAAAAAAAITVVVMGAGRVLERPPARHDPAPVAVETPSTRQVEVVRFVLSAPGASAVALIGDFNGWDPAATPLRRTEPTDVWVVDVPLTPGRHEYGFLIDGREWRSDPAAPRGADNEYGRPNSVLTVGLHSS
jgi:hypothetical protein